MRSVVRPRVFVDKTTKDATCGAKEVMNIGTGCAQVQKMMSDCGARLSSALNWPRDPLNMLDRSQISKNGRYDGVRDLTSHRQEHGMFSVTRKRFRGARPVGMSNRFRCASPCCAWSTPRGTAHLPAMIPLCRGTSAAGGGARSPAADLRVQGFRVVKALPDVA